MIWRIFNVLCHPNAPVWQTSTSLGCKRSQSQNVCPSRSLFSPSTWDNAGPTVGAHDCLMNWWWNHLLTVPFLLTHIQTVVKLYDFHAFVYPVYISPSANHGPSVSISYLPALLSPHQTITSSLGKLPWTLHLRPQPRLPHCLPHPLACHDSDHVTSRHWEAECPLSAKHGPHCCSPDSPASPTGWFSKAPLTFLTATRHAPKCRGLSPLLRKTNIFILPGLFLL